MSTAKRDLTTSVRVEKCDAVVDYNINMCQVDCSDMMIREKDCLWRRCKWYHKAFLHLLDVAALNALTLYLVKTSNQMKLRQTTA